MKIIEGEKISITEKSNEINDLKKKLRERIDNDYVPLIIRKDITRLEEQGAIKRPDFLKHVKKFYNYLEYIIECTVEFEDIKNLFSLGDIKKKILWKYIEKPFKYISNHFPKNIFDEVSLVKRYVTDEKIKC